MIQQIDLGQFGEYRLSLIAFFGMPATLSASCPDKTRCRTYSPKLLGPVMVESNDAIREAFDRAVARGYRSMVTA